MHGGWKKQAYVYLRVNGIMSFMEITLTAKYIHTVKQTVLSLSVQYLGFLTRKSVQILIFF